VQRPVTLRASETTQVEFVRAVGINAKRSYVYIGSDLKVDSPSKPDSAYTDQFFGANSNTKVVIVSEFKNDTAHHLGVPLPQGRFHFYRLDHDRELQFTGESSVENTAEEEMVRAVSGNAFDIAGERRQTDFRINEEERTLEESFEIKLRNHRKEPVEIRVVEHPTRWRTWEVTAKSQEFKKTDPVTIEFQVPVKSNEEKAVTYSIRYSRLPRPRP
jgi:hypothetical protein